MNHGRCGDENYDPRPVILLIGGVLLLMGSLFFHGQSLKKTGFYVEVGARSGQRRVVYWLPSSSKPRKMQEWLQKHRKDGYMVIYPDALVEDVPDLNESYITSRKNHYAATLGFLLYQKIKVNQATEQELALLPGIGPTLAHKILISRSQQGNFHSAEDMTRVHGIGKKLALRLAPYLLFQTDGPY